MKYTSQKQYGIHTLKLSKSYVNRNTPHKNSMGYIH